MTMLAASVATIVRIFRGIKPMDCRSWTPWIALVLAVPLSALAQPSSRNEDKKVTASLIADVQGIQPGKPFWIGVRFDIPKGYYTYYKSPGGIGLPTKVSFVAPKEFVIGEPRFPGPEVKRESIDGKPLDLFIYKKSTVVLAEVMPPASLPAGEPVVLSARVSFQFCEEKGSCFPPRPQTLTLQLPVSAGSAPAPSASAAEMAATRRSLPAPPGQSRFAKLEASLVPASLAAGRRAELLIAVEVESGHKLQMHQPPVAGLISTDVILDTTPGIEYGAPMYPPAEAPKKLEPGLEGLKEYRGRFVIRVPVRGKETLAGAEVVLGGLLRYQACTDEGTCYPPAYAAFTTRAPIDSGAASTGPSAPARPTAAMNPNPPASDTNEGGDSVVLSPAVREFLAGVDPMETASSPGGLLHYLLFAFIGGLILNVMPCVLPVIAIKVLSFVRQAGESRSHIFLLNVAYSAGVIAVFLTLATLAVALNIGWGGLFQRPEFNIAMAGLVFAMGLSLLGVFEIPVPGFAGSMAASGQDEGPVAAFFTGVLATLLATPCSGPFLGVTLGWSVLQPPLVTYLVWTTMGLGMASPYLVIGLFPGLVRWLPRPGNWMVTFKELAGLVLMGTVVFIIWFLDERYTIPVLVMLLGITIASWMIGNLYSHSSPAHHKNLVRVGAMVVAAGIIYFSMTFVLRMVERKHEFQLLRQKSEWARESGVRLPEPVAGENAAELAWQPFSGERVVELIAEGRTVLVDFSAAWCLTCKANEANALNTPATVDLVRELNAVTVYADYTALSPEIKQWLDRFHSIGVPLTVIFPGRDARRPIILRDLYTQATLLASLREAGPSKPQRDQASARVP